MLKKLVLTLSLVSILFLNLLSQSKIKGYVFDAETDKPLPGTNVYIENLKLGSATDQNGYFEINNVPAGKINVVASFVGYEKQKKQIDLSPGEEINLNFYLKPTALPSQTIVVTALIASERESPVVFSNLDKQQIKDFYTTQDVPILLSELPSVLSYSWSGNGIGYNYLNIRGFDQRRISVLVNGIPQNDPEDHGVYWLDMPDLLASSNAVQIQRGAGSAFYGPPAIGGSVNIITSNFSLEPKISLFTGYGSYNTKKHSIAINSGLIANRYSLYSRLSYIATDGYREKSWAKFPSYFFSAIRYDDNMTTQINLYGGPFEDHLVYRGIPKEWVKDKTKRRANLNYMDVTTRDDEIENFSQPHYELLHEWRFGENLTLNNTLFYIRGVGFWDMDASWGDTVYFRLSKPYAEKFNFAIPSENPGEAIARYFIDLNQYGWLPRLTLKHQNGELTIGAEFRIHRGFHWGKIVWAQNLPKGLPSDYRFYEYKGAKDIISFYIHEFWRLKQNLRLMASLQFVYNRYRVYDEKEFYDYDTGKWVSNEFSVPYYFLNPKIGISYDLTQNINIFGSFSITNREPSRRDLYDASDGHWYPWGKRPNFEVKPDGTFDFTKPLVKPERLFDLELGAGYFSDDYKFTANFYYMDFRNELVKSGQLNIFGDPIIGNAERTRHLGVELTAEIKNLLINGLEFTGNATISRNRIVKHGEYVWKNPYTGESYSTPQRISLDGKKIAGFPDYIGSARVSYRNYGFLISLLGKYVGEFYTDNFNLVPSNNVARKDRKVDAYTVFDLTIAYRFEKILGLKNIELKLQVNNLFNALYAGSGVGDDFYPGAERNYFVSIGFDL
ncbi:TonB-dependent receptor [Candidatus Chrysopegis kryptomonas]|uniref:Iron complex outermembrane recepter protein n=1 Tax=Candidatus Chryseopegocella kryptomonas TaxID=1633643 RepID=A0A0P1NVS7_9BACT|nr:TonB-dependent receptor [Candidatus Chrysopegis kryptomonas]CUT03661.1 iron complex outermembrane recepter protein [Candidatus Chrysopegis kryptomonas]